MPGDHIMSANLSMPQTFTCDHCQVCFTASKASRRGKRKFCSVTCKKAYTAVRQPKLVCLQCCKEFVREAGRPIGKKTFCSRACLKEYYKTTNTTKICPGCDKQFITPNLKSRSNQYCSRACRAKFSRDIVCERCGKVFHFNSNTTRRYCSRECAYRPYFRECPRCGTTFQTYPSWERRFCTNRCSRLWKGRSGLELKVADILQQIGADYIEQVKIGTYWVDFILLDQRIALEADGTYWHNRPERQESDARKTALLEQRGWCVVHITDLELKHELFPAQLLKERITIPRLMPG